MEKVKLSVKSKRSEAALDKTNARLLAAGLELEARTKVLEELIQRKEILIRRERELLAELDAEHEVIDAEVQRIRNMSPALR